MLPLNDTDFWWLRYGLGIAAPVVSWAWGLYSIVMRHSYVLLRGGWGTRIIPVHGLQAVLAGVAFVGLSLALYGNCYAQYHEKMAYHYQWFSIPGLLLFISGVAWCYWIFIAS